LVKDYKILIKSRPITEQVIHDLKLNMTHEELITYIDVVAPIDTRIIEIQVSHPDAALAKRIADSIAEISSESMVSIMGMEQANIIEEGNLPTIPSSPSIIKNTVIGGAIGILLTAGIIILITLLNDSIKTEADIERYLELTVLGFIPIVENPKKHKKLNREFKKSYKRGGAQNAFY
jgi:capsular polysaccharide biosynthesis protein